MDILKSSKFFFNVIERNYFRLTLEIVEHSQEGMVLPEKLDLCIEIIGTANDKRITVLSRH